MSLLMREENRVNYMDHTVGGFGVSDDDLYGVVQEDLAILYLDGKVRTVGALLDFYEAACFELTLP